MSSSDTARPSILIIVQNLPVPFDRRVWQEATSLREANYNVAVICPKKKIYTKSYEQLEGVDIYRYPLIYEAHQGTLGYIFEFAYCWLAALWLSIKAYLHRPFSVIHACNPPETFFALALLFRPLGVKFIFDHHDLSPEMYVAKGRSKNSQFYKALILLERFTLKTADLVIAVNKSHKEIAVKRGDIPESKIVIVRSGPRSSWATVDTPDDNLKKGRKYLAVYLGEMCEQDGVDYLLRAIQHYRLTYPADTTFALVGGGPDQQRMKEMSEGLGLNDTAYFTGRISDKDLWTYLSTADVCVDPDPYTEWSNLSTMNKIIEYMSFGRPIISFDLVEHRRSAEAASIYVEPNDTVKFSESIRTLLEDETKRLAMSKFGKQRFVEELTWDKSSKILIEAYERILNTN